ncbi:response regulator transcription factor [Luteococcus peritonei]|uniref:Response regulator n=1 Tax=Luteococcus peritonei TaxID=88874 RepID=A0ABW4RXZ7_9ACTN
MIRVLLADDQPLVRTGFAMILSVEPDLEVVGQASDGQQAVQLARELRPDVTLMDVQMPRLDGVGATAALVAEDLGKVVILTTFDRDDYLFDALQAGASGFLLKNSEPERLVEAIHAAVEGHALLSPEVTTRVIARMGRDRTRPGTAPGARPGHHGGAGHPELTAREREVLCLMAQGLSNAEIAGLLFVGEATVKTHVSNVLAKLGLRDRVQAVVWAYRHGLVDPATD